MWSFIDAEGSRWDVVLGRESWGTFYALFVPRAGGRVRQAPLRADSHADAQEEVEAGGAEGLELLFRSSLPKSD